jgi:dTDP-glucose 4,6-dehydratase
MFDDEVTNTIMNIGSGFRITKLNIINKISTVLNKDVEIQHVEDRLGHDRKYSLMSQKMRRYYLEKQKKTEFKSLYDYLEEQYGND